MPNALAAQLKKKGTWRKLLPLVGFPIECLTGKSAACPFCKAGASFTWKEYPNYCWGKCSVCKVNEDGWRLVGRKTGLSGNDQELGRLIASKVDLFYFGPDPDAPRFETRSASRRKTFNGF